MTVKVADSIAVLKSAGFSDRDARIQAFLRSVVDDENAKAQRGEGYDSLRVGIATVHSRDDLVLLVAQGKELLRADDEQVRLLRHIRLTLALLLACAVVALVR